MKANLVVVLLVMFMIGGIAYLKYKVKRYINWNFDGYSSNAIELVCDMVKPSALKDPTVCKK